MLQNTSTHFLVYYAGWVHTVKIARIRTKLGFILSIEVFSKKKFTFNISLRLFFNAFQCENFYIILHCSFNSVLLGVVWSQQGGTFSTRGSKNWRQKYLWTRYPPPSSSAPPPFSCPPPLHQQRCTPLWLSQTLKNNISSLITSSAQTKPLLIGQRHEYITSMTSWGISMYTVT